MLCSRVCVCVSENGEVIKHPAECFVTEHRRCATERRASLATATGALWLQEGESAVSCRTMSKHFRTEVSIQANALSWSTVNPKP